MPFYRACGTQVSLKSNQSMLPTKDPISYMPRSIHISTEPETPKIINPPSISPAKYLPCPTILTPS